VTEPLVAISDYLLAAETASLAYAFRVRHRRSDLSGWIVLLFLALSAASLAGGTTHGFFLDETSVGHAIFWPATLLAIGATALCLAAIAFRLGFDPGAARRSTWVALAFLLVYCLIVLFVYAEFLVAILAYLPAVLLLLAVLLRVWLRRHRAPYLLGVLAVVLTLLASAVQQASFSIPGLPHANNVLYHLIEAIALFILFLAFLGIERVRT